VTIVADKGKAPLERELVIARTLNASRELVFAAWTDPRRALQLRLTERGTPFPTGGAVCQSISSASEY